MKGNYIEFSEVKQLLTYLRKFQTPNIYFKDIYFRIVVLVRLILQLAFKVDRNQLIIHLDKLISDTERADDDSDKDYSLTPLSPIQKNELEELCNELFIDDVEKSNKELDLGKSEKQYLDDFEY
jgi:hypothetical protein